MSSYYQHQYSGNTDPEKVIVQSKSQKPPRENKLRWSWCSTGWSIFTMLCCSPFVLCGLLGLVFSMGSYTDHKMGDWDRSSYKRKCAWCCSMTAIVLGLLVILAILLIIFVSPWDTYITDLFT